ncbi:MAG: T9SS type A sorting domain-containing protein, partial [Flavobacteriales bacterium]|nr:T9SS type A sorting domain-containing protein [Flavobacteriales bacterium]
TMIGENLAAKFVVYPMPVKESFTINFEGNTRKFILQNAQGKVIFTKALYSGEIVDMSRFEAGIYFLREARSDSPATKIIKW